MFDRMRTFPTIYYAAIDPGGNGGGVAPGGQQQGAPTPGAQPGGQGNGQGGGFREQFFQGVPDEVWGQVEPHVRNVQGHLTQLEQRYAPFKGYRDQDLQGLAEFSQRFDRDPVGQWVNMARGLQQAGVLDPELDLDHLASLVTGQDPEPTPNPAVQNGDMPEWAQALNKRLDQLEGGVNKFQTSHQQQVEDAVLKRQIGGIKASLKAAEIPDGAFSEETILASYIAHRGNAQMAAQSLVNARNELLKGYVKGADPNQQQQQRRQTQTQSNDLELPNGAPQARGRGATRGRGKMIPSQTRAAAEQFLRKQDQ